MKEVFTAEQTKISHLEIDKKIKIKFLDEFRIHLEAIVSVAGKWSSFGMPKDINFKIIFCEHFSHNTL